MIFKIILCNHKDPQCNHKDPQWLNDEIWKLLNKKMRY